MRIKLFIILFSCMFFWGCGGLDEGGTQKISGPPIDPESTLEVVDLAGIWSMRSEVKGLNDEVWAENEYLVVITDAGEYFEYDYLGDSLASKGDQYRNCYVLFNAGRLEKRPMGGFAQVYESEFVSIKVLTNYDLIEDQLITAEYPGYIDSKVIAIPRSNLLLEDITAMLCEGE